MTDPVETFRLRDPMPDLLRVRKTRALARSVGARLKDRERLIRALDERDLGDLSVAALLLRLSETTLDQVLLISELRRRHVSVPVPQPSLSTS